MELAIFAGGCFWCTEAIFEELRGVKFAISGYANCSSAKAPSYEAVCSGKTGCAETIKIEYDPEQISYEDLLTVFFYTHDPTALNRQGADIGEQYRSAIFYTDKKQKQQAESFIRQLIEEKAYDKPIVTEIKPLNNFFEAENYHQDFYKNNQNATYCQVVIAPKIEKLKKRFQNLLKNK